MNKTLLSPLLLSIFLCLNATAQTFQEVTIPGVKGANRAALRWGDFNGDSALDLVVGSPNGFQVFIQNKGSFAVLNYDTLKTEARRVNDAIDLADLNGDNFIDLVVSGGSNTKVFDILENKQGLFYSYLNGGFPLSFSLSGFSNWGDADQDGDPDILFAGFDQWSNERNGIYINQKGIFHQRSLVENYFTYAFWTDIDEDLDLDIVGYERSNNYGYGNYIGQNNGKGSFSSLSTSSSVTFYDAQLADYNHDNQMDYLLKVADGYALFIINKEGLQKDEGFEFPKSNSAHWADFNNDGWTDILFYGGDSYCYDYAPCNTYIYYNNEGKSFIAKEIPEIRGMPEATSAIADYDEDGDLDIAIVGNGEFHLFKNQWIETGNAPGRSLPAPNGLSETVQGNEVLLSWERANGSGPSSQTHTYHVYLRREDGSFVVSPLADISSGKRYLPENGNSALASQFKVSCLQDGTYFWAVQTIDAAYKGSAFSSERKIVISGFEVKKPESFTAAVLSNDKVELKWNDVADNEEEYLVYRRLKNTEFSPFDSPLITLPQNTQEFIDNIDVMSATAYVYRIVAANCSYPSDSFAEVGATTFPEAYIESNKFYLDKASGTFSSFGDLDNDGDLDLLISYSNDFTNTAAATRIFMNEEDGYVSTGQEFPAMSNQSNFQWVDFNKDGYLDLWVKSSSYFTNDSLYILLNNKNGLFGEEGVISVDLSAFSQYNLFWEDVNRDGDIDLLVQNRDSGVNYKGLSLLKNTGHYKFELVENNNLEGTVISRQPWGDYDNDGDLDFFVVRSDDCGVNYWVLYNQYAPLQFREERLGDIPALDDGFTISETQAIWLDYNSDGWLDIFFSGRDYCGNGSGITKLIKNEKGNFKLVSETSFSPEVYDIQLACADYDNNGSSDIIMYGDPFSSGYQPHTRIYAYNATEGYQETSVTNLQPYTHRGHMAIGDIDRDGDIDVLILGEKNYTSPKIILYESNLAQSWNRANTPPAYPTNLKTEKLEKGLRLSWDPASDSETPVNGLFYNVYVKDAEGNYIINPYATETGSSTRFSLGNAQKNTFIFLNNLPKGAYTWGVQAIDNGLLASIFSPVQDFIKEEGGEVISGLIEDPNNFKIHLYPNPAEEREVFLKFPESLSGNFTLQLTDLRGKILLQRTGQIKTSKEEVLQLDNLSSGIYIIIIRKENKVTTQRLLLN